MVTAQHFGFVEIFLRSKMAAADLFAVADSLVATVSSSRTDSIGSVGVHTHGAEEKLQGDEEKSTLRGGNALCGAV